MDKDDAKNDLVVEIDESQLDLLKETGSEPESKADDKSAEVEVKTEAEPPKKERKRHNEDAIKALEAQVRAREEELAQERNARARAEERARKREAEAEAARGRAAQSDYDRVQGYIAAAKAKESELKRAIRAASEMGEHDKIAELHTELASVAVRKLQYEDAKREMEIRAERSEREPREAEPAPQRHQPVHSDPFEAQIATLSEPSKAWLRQHRECVTDEAMNAKVIWAHKDALKQGIRPDTAEYFAHLENRMGFNVSSDDETEDDVEISPRQE